MKQLIELDDLDRRILEQLQRDSQITNQELAQKVHASAPTSLRRVKALYDNGVIVKQVAIVNPNKVQAMLSAIVEITLDVQAAEHYSSFEQSLVNEKAILQCYRVANGPDFVVILQVREMSDYHDLVHRLFTAKNNVRSLRTFFSTHRSKFETYIPFV